MSEGSKFHSCGAETEKPSSTRIAPSDTEEPGVEPETMTEGCALLGCHSGSGRARSSTPVHGQPGSCSLWSLVCIEYETESEASEGHVELQPRSVIFANSEDQTCSRVEDRLETVEEVGTCPIEKLLVLRPRPYILGPHKDLQTVGG